MPPSTTRPVMGVMLMLATVFLFPFSDGLAKYLFEFHSVLFILWCRFLISSVCVLPIAMMVDKQQGLSGFRLGWQTLRACFLTIQMLLLYAAFSHAPLADAMGAFFIAPIFAMVLAMFILKEKLNRQKIISVTLGFIGTIIILQPEGSLEIGMIYAIGSGLFYAFSLITTKIVVQTSPPFTTFTFQSIIGTIVLTPFIFSEAHEAAFPIPDQKNLFIIIFLTVITIVAYILMIYAFRFAQASTLSPLTYFEWVGAVFVGFLLFGDIPNWVTWIGTLFIILGGLSLLNLKITKALLKNNRLLNMVSALWSKTS